MILEFMIPSFIFSHNARRNSSNFLTWECDQECCSAPHARGASCHALCYVCTLWISVGCQYWRAWFWKHQNLWYSDSQREKCRWVLAMVHDGRHRVWCCEVGMHLRIFCNYELCHVAHYNLSSWFLCFLLPLWLELYMRMPVFSFHCRWHSTMLELWWWLNLGSRSQLLALSQKEVHLAPVTKGVHYYMLNFKYSHFSLVDSIWDSDGPCMCLLYPCHQYQARSFLDSLSVSLMRNLSICWRKPGTVGIWYFFVSYLVHSCCGLWHFKAIVRNNRFYIIPVDQWPDH